MVRSGFEWAANFPNAAHRLIPNVVDELARDDPDRIVYELADADDVTKPFEKISAWRFANAINRAAKWLHDTLGKQDSTPTVGYLGPQDLRYLILVVATIKAGYKILLISNRNSIEGDVAVIKATECTRWLVPSHGTNIHRLADSVSLTLYDFPDLKFFTDATPAPHFPYGKSWEQGRKDTLWIVHTSGSTGNPKPVFRYLDSAAASGANTLMPKINGRSLLLHDFFDSRAYLTFPLFHTAGLANGLLWPLFNGTTIVLGPQKPVELELMKDVIRWAKPDTIFTAPSIVQDIAKDDEFLRLLETVRSIACGGGPVSKEAGDRVWKHTKLRISIGTSESGNLPCVETDPEDWNYLHFHPYTGFELQDQGGGLYELVAVRQPQLEAWQPIFSTFPDLQEYRTKDLFSRHPTKPDLYTYEGRADNILVLSNGEKIQPHSIETAISSHPLVDIALLAGQGKFQTALLVQLNNNHPSHILDKEKIVDLIWPTIDLANRSAPTHGRIFRDFVLVADTTKPFSTTSKGTVRRGPTLQLYQQEIENLYVQADAKVDKGAVPLNLSNLAEVRDKLRRIVASVTGQANLQDDDDFFAAGVDSLQVLVLSRALRKEGWLDGEVGSTLSGALIYQNPTINSLTEALLKAAEGPTSDIVNGHSIPANGERVTVEELIKKYADFGISNGVENKSEAGQTVILTGSTGSLGSYLLNSLLELETVREVWCLNRSPDAEERQKHIHDERGLSTDFARKRVFFRQASLSKDNLGLAEGDYAHLVGTATHVIHTQWQVDFNLQLASFEPHIRGVRQLVEFGLDAHRRGRQIRLFFTSSVAVANKAQSTTFIPEERINSYEIAGSGYGESKLVSEAVLLEAGVKAGLDVAVARVGQIAGPVLRSKRGQWNKKEWFPSLIDASAYLGALPQTLGRNESVDWIPVDILATAVLELALDGREGAGQASVFHLVNPHRVRWESAVLPTVQTRLGITKTVPIDIWVAMLETAAKEAGESPAAALSAFKLADFFKGLSIASTQRPGFETCSTCAASTTLHDVTPVQSEWVGVWLDQWGY
ncbi:hypothetical protein FB567DRAFT_629884 [Paraphoma chrysanthemicola]|uniref:Carrier domain-containing protein n=1 Tax=Paraphoma chrysanthemicola TaxID=798071 RepID=A0A8K0R391_9PLEO|nr:hypothetical protein FB567DRAFT_629884 [Paraphoma chrysanthemicola]